MQRSQAWGKLFGVFFALALAGSGLEPPNWPKMTLLSFFWLPLRTLHRENETWCKTVTQSDFSRLLPSVALGCNKMISWQYKYVSRKFRLFESLSWLCWPSSNLLYHLNITDRAATKQNFASHSLCKSKYGKCSNNKQFNNNFVVILSNSSY